MAVQRTTLVAAQDNANGPFSMCSDGSCQDCPVSLTSAGTGYPQCVIYSSNDVFPNADPPFNSSSSGGWSPFFNVSQPDPECRILVKSPADTDVAGCGDLIASYRSHTCSNLLLKDTFMVQVCCGEDDCEAATGTTKRGDSRNGGVYLMNPDGTIMQPAKVGPMISGPTNSSSAKTQRLSRRDAACTQKSWVADPGMESYTRPSDQAQVVIPSITSGETLQITKERSVSYSESLMAGLSFEDIFMIGVSFSVSEEMSESKSRSFTAPDGENGEAVFTPRLQCSTGTGTCNGGSLHGEICSGYMEAGEIAGDYTVVANN